MFFVKPNGQNKEQSYTLIVAFSTNSTAKAGLLRLASLARARTTTTLL